MKMVGSGAVPSSFGVNLADSHTGTWFLDLIWQAITASSFQSQVIADYPVSFPHSLQYSFQ